MNKKKIIPLCLALMLILSSNMILWISAATTPRVYVDPATVIFSSDPTQPNYGAVGDTFEVNVNVADFVEPGVYAYGFDLHYDNTSLEAVALEMPEGHFLTPTLDPGNIFSQLNKILHNEGKVQVAPTLLGDEPGKTGSGILVTITFNITAAPPPAGVLSCPLELQAVKFADPDITPITVTAENGYYEYAAPKPPLPYLKVLPETASAEEVGDQIVVDITVQELAADWQAVGFQWKLIYDTAILEVLGNVSEGDFLKQFGDTYFHAIVEEDYIISFTLYLDPFEPGFTGAFPEGSGTLATITFGATHSPGSCDLELTEVIIVDVDVTAIETRPHESGKYVIPLPPWLSIEPDVYTALALNEEFDLTVFINELKGDLEMVGAEFKIRYNLTMLELTTITEAGFMKHFAGLSGTDTWFQYYVEEDPTSGYGIAGILILPLDNGTWPGPFPDTTDYGAPGDLATVTFKAIHQHDTLDLTSDIYLDNIILANTEATEIPYDTTKTTEEGICKYTIGKAIPPFPGEVDLFTWLYPAPYGGQDLDQRSDAFAPQMYAMLAANVTYNGDPVLNKLVTLTLNDAHDALRAVVTSITGDDGIANFTYRIPSWPYGPNATQAALDAGIFGDWVGAATVDLAGEMVWDTMVFSVGWLIEATNIAAHNGESPFKKGEVIHFDVTISSIFMQGLSTNCTVVVTDEVGHPIGYTYISYDKPQEGYVNYPRYFNYPRYYVPENILELTITIPYWCFSGTGAIRVNLLPGPYCPEAIAEIEIRL